MQLTAEELRTAVGGQWIVPPPAPAPRQGLPAAPFMVHGVGTDTREELKGTLFIALRGDRFDAHQFLADAHARGAAAAMVDRKAAPFARPDGLPLLEVGDTRVALGDLARFWRTRLRGKVVAITGSSGKTTTRRLVDAALATVMKGSASPKSFNNDIGVPLTLLGAGSGDGYLVAEIGMSHPGEITPLARIAAPHVAIITMAGRAHLAGMGSAEAIIQEKASLVDGLSTLGIAIVNGDQPALVAAVEQRVKPGVRVVTFGMGPNCLWKLVGRSAAVAGRSPAGIAQAIRVREPDGSEWSADLGLAGEYNAMNALAALACARMLGVPQAQVAAAFAAIRPSEMRMTRQEIGPFALYNDAYNANPDAVQAALRAFAEIAADAPRRVVVLGDMLELGQASAALHAEVARAAIETKPGLAIFVGAESAHGAREAQRALGALGEVGSLAAPDADAAGRDRAAPNRGTVVLHVPALDDQGISAIAGALRAGDAILLKGSRGSRMERLVQALSARAPGAAPAEGSAPCSTT